MRKLALVFAVAVTFGIVATPFVQAVAADKKLWEGWIEEVKKAAEGAKKK
ncbi:MAG: hypothetical protein IT539_03065 [Bradyrhizobiaceae bacterium]|nr:hypothetical protein [Bradyrhizobiaceae bacterium]